ncbi:vitamin K epoxide reductase family protein [Microbacterium amylolyticum]|uniref:Membrane protein n=1 Tax=Microbacterium amylolyticum TaxID=936337 RepID=A0ABS4ZEI5_9MICO|nr:vitamin K epoxide reductase family protein [Microbacterium amylolyticum]MBP2435696.1 putative membrane protein [Microbacterium amylolyticum]
MEKTHTRPTVLALWLVIAGAVGLWAAFELTLEKLAVLADPDHMAACDFSVVIQCGANLSSEQGAVFGFPNPLIGLIGWMAPLVVGVAILSGARFAKWFWALFAGGMTFAFGFVIWLIWQSIFILGTLCPWCMVTWVVTIPSFFAVILHTVRIGAIPLPRGVRTFANTLMGWMPLIVTVAFVTIAVIAELRLNLLDMFF